MIGAAWNTFKYHSNYSKFNYKKFDKLYLKSCTHRSLFVGQVFVICFRQPRADQVVDNIPDLRLQSGALDGILEGVAHIVSIYAGIADQLLQLLVDGLVALSVLDGRDYLCGHMVDAGILQLLHADSSLTRPFFLRITLPLTTN